MALAVTATAGGSTGNGMLLRVYVLTGAAAAASQTGNSNSTQFTVSTNWTASIANSSGSNIYLAAEIKTSSPSTLTGSNMTIVDQVSDATNGQTYVTGHATGLASGTTSRGFTFSISSNTGPFTMLEILASGTIAEDGSAPAVASTTAATTVTTASFTPPPGSLLVALVSSNGGISATTMTVSGGSLTWTEAVKNNPSGGHYAGVWIADGPAAAGTVTAAAVRGRAGTARGKVTVSTARAVSPQPARVTVRAAAPPPPRGRVTVSTARAVFPRPARVTARAPAPPPPRGRVAVVLASGTTVVPPPAVRPGIQRAADYDGKSWWKKRWILRL